MINMLASVLGLVVPPLFDFAKKKWLTPAQDNPMATLNGLAVSKPDIMPEYMKSLALLMESQTKFYNRDVIGTPSQFVVNLRASIRPVFVILSVLAMILSPFAGVQIPGEIQTFMSVNISSWFGSRLVQ